MSTNNVKCLTCEKEFSKRKSEIKKSDNHFCSRSCAAKSNNKLFPKRTKKNTCTICSTSIHSQRKYCKECYAAVRQDDDLTLKDCAYDHLHRSSAYAKIRSRARSVAQKLGWNSCSVCGYNKHVEISHIKPISSFDPSTPVSVINDPSNLQPLCPNCHWEFDNLVKL